MSGEGAFLPNGPPRFIGVDFAARDSIGAVSAPRCVDCEHFTRALFPSLRLPNCWCARPVTQPLDLVNGRTERRLNADPWDERKPGRRIFGLGRERCGLEAKFFKPATSPAAVTRIPAAEGAGAGHVAPSCSGDPRGD